MFISAQRKGIVIATFIAFLCLYSLFYSGFAQAKLLCAYGFASQPHIPSLETFHGRERPCNLLTFWFYGITWVHIWNLTLGREELILGDTFRFHASVLL